MWIKVNKLPLHSTEIVCQVKKDYRSNLFRKTKSVLTGLSTIFPDHRLNVKVTLLFPFSFLEKVW